jgi:hypothetical protein
MRSGLICLASLLAVVLGETRLAGAQPYCAMYNNGSKDCGIPSLEACRQSVDGIGGRCEQDFSSQMRPDFFQRPRLFQPAPDSAPADSGNSQGNLDFVPPPPDR